MQSVPSTTDVVGWTPTIYNHNIAWFGFMVFSATFNNISFISWRVMLFSGEAANANGHMT
jgi:hypothetical protein